MARTDGITMNNYKLPFSLTPAEGESVQGYLARLTIENCCADTKDLLRVTRIPGGTSSNFQRTGSWKSAVKCFELLKESDIQHAIDHFRQQGEQYKFTPQIRNMARCCPLCLEQKPIQKFELLITVKTHCQVHGIPLIDTCTCCDAPLNFDAIERGQCNYCASGILDGSVKESTLPQYLDGIIALRGRELQQASKQLLDCAGRLLRPFDILPGKSETLEQINNSLLIQIFTAAYELIHSPAAREYYAEEVEQHRNQAVTLGPHVARYPAYEFEYPDIEHENYPRVSTSYLQWKSEAAIPNKVKAVLKAKDQSFDDDVTKYIADLWAANKILGTSCAELASFVEEGLIEPIKRSKKIQGILVDIRDFAELVEQQPVVPTNTASVSLDKLRQSEFFERYSVSLGKLVASPSIQNYISGKGDGVSFTLLEQK